jgi:Fic family protein
MGQSAGQSNGPREYEATHPWVTFNINLEHAPWQLWHMLGEISADCEAITRIPLRPEVAHHLHRMYLAKGVQATTAIEGNNLSEQQILRIVDNQPLDLPPSQQYQEVEAENIIEAVNAITKRLFNEDTALTPEVVADYNRQVLEGTVLEEGVVPGEWRKHSVLVGSYRGVPWQDCDHLMRRLCDWLNSDAVGPVDEDQQVMLAVIKAVLAHLYLAWIHPFGDGNGRTARLIEFHLLVEAGVPLPAAHLLSNHYNQTRTRYYAELDRASKSQNPIPFLMYAAAGFQDGLNQQLELIRQEHWAVAWENYVHSQFQARHGETAERRKHLVLDISKQEGPVKRAQIKELSPRLARLYAGRTDKMITRDINALIDMGLLRRSPEGLLPYEEQLLGFSPPADRRL